MKKSALSIIFMTVFIDLMGFGILVPLLPTFATSQLGVSDFGVGILFGVFSLVQFIFNPVLGKISDKYGRRPIILISLLCTITSYIIFGFANSFLVLFISRVLAGFGGSNIAVAQAYIADITEKHERSKGMGLIGMAFGLGFVFGPLIGGLLSVYGYQFAGFASAAFSTLAFIWAFFRLDETVVKKENNELSSVRPKIFDFSFAYKTILHADSGLLIFLFFIITFSSANIFGTFALLAFKVYHLNNQQIGYQFAILGIVSAIVQGGLIKYFSVKFSEKSLILSGTFILIFGLGLLPYGVNFFGLAVVIILNAFGTGLLQPIVLSMISKYTSDIEQGAVLGLNQSLSALGRVLGPLWGGFAFEYLGYEFPFLTGAFFMFITFLFSVFLFSKDKYSKSHAYLSNKEMNGEIGKIGK